MSNSILYYDNLFTSNLFTGTSSGKLNLSTNQLNGKLWTELDVDRVYPNVTFPKGAFFIIKTFTPTESGFIVDAIKKGQAQTMYFDQFGNLIIFDGPIASTPKPNMKINFINITASIGSNINYDSPSGLVDMTNILNNKLILSKYNTYILNLYDKSKVQILYNPLHRKSFKDFYKSLIPGLDGFNSSDDNNNNKDVSTLVDKYCEIMASKNTKNGERNYADPTCKCLGTINTRTYGKTVTGDPDPVGECIDEAIGHVTIDQVRQQTGLNCVCAAPSCATNIPDSFLSNFVTNVKSQIPKCPDIKTSFCSMIVNAGGGINATNATLSQRCGDNADYKAAVTVTTPPPTTQPPATQPPTTQPPTTKPPATQPPATQPPATQPPTTQPPATQPPATQPPTTQPPATQPPATQTPTTKQPITQPPSPVLSTATSVEGSSFPVIYIGIGAGVLILAVIAFLLSRKK